MRSWLGALARALSFYGGVSQLRVPDTRARLDEAVVEDNRPSCSVRMLLASQGLFVNDVAVRFAAQLLYELSPRAGFSSTASSSTWPANAQDR